MPVLNSPAKRSDRDIICNCIYLIEKVEIEEIKFPTFQKIKLEGGIHVILNYETFVQEKRCLH